MPKTKTQKPKVDMSGDKESVQTRTARAKVVETAAKSSPIFAANAGVQQAQGDLVTAGADLAKADDDVNAAELKLEQLRSDRSLKVEAFDTSYGVYVAVVEKNVTASVDIEGLGLVTLTRQSYTLAAPLGVEVRYDVAADVVRIHVKMAPGMTSTLIEVGPSANGPWTRLDTVGARQALSGYAPGTYWIHAASVRASERSDWTSPVAVIVK